MSFRIGYGYDVHSDHQSSHVHSSKECIVSERVYMTGAYNHSGGSLEKDTTMSGRCLLCLYVVGCRNSILITNREGGVMTTPVGWMTWQSVCTHLPLAC